MLLRLLGEVSKLIEMSTRWWKNCVVLKCISKTKWFGQDVYEVDGFVLVHFGRPIPADGEPVQRNEGVGILLNPTMAAAWRNSWECWRAISSRIVSVCIQFQKDALLVVSADKMATFI